MRIPRYRLYIAYLFATVLLISAFFMRGANTPWLWHRAVYLATSWLTFSACCMIPLAIPMLLSHIRRFWEKSRVYRCVVYGMTALFAFALHVFLISDAIMYLRFGYHINGLVVNLLLTPGGIESMGLPPKDIVLINILLVLVLIVDIVVVVATLCRPRLQAIAMRWPWGNRIILLVASVAIIAVAMAISFVYNGIADYKGKSDILNATNTFPCYPAVRMRHLLKTLGVTPGNREKIRIDNAARNSNDIYYPQRAIVREAHTRYNILWVTAESLRHDMLTPEIMPNLWRRAEQHGWRFVNHYSGGHGTRPGLFSMFYALYGNNWNPFLHNTRCPLLFDWLKEDGYAFLCQTSAKFTYPEFDRTIFAAMKPNELHEYPKGIPWQRDIQNIDSIIAFIQAQYGKKPFFAFAFLESTHAPYSFPNESAVRSDFLPEMEYATVSKENVKPLFNRAVNAAHFVDMQIERLFQALEALPNVRENTIVVFTGDHGEEFFEKGHWGHNSTFVEEQIRPPLVLFVPGKAAGVYNQLSHHTDIIPSIAPLLGVTNPPEDYSVGGNLFDSAYKRTFFITCGWDIAIFATPSGKLLLPLGNKQLFRKDELTTLDDRPLNDVGAFYKTNAAALGKAQRDMNRFVQRKRER